MKSAYTYAVTYTYTYTYTYIYVESRGAEVHKSSILMQDRKFKVL